MESILIGAFSYCSAVLFATNDELKAIKAARAEAETDPDTASITPVCDPDDSKSSLRSVRFSNISIINIIPLSPSTISTTTTTTEEEEEDEISNLHDVTCSLISSPSSSVEEYAEVKTSQPQLPPSLPTQLRSASQHQHQHQHRQQQQQQHQQQQQQNRQRFLGHKNRRRRVRKLLKEDIAHRRRKEEEYDRERRVKE